MLELRAQSVFYDSEIEFALMQRGSDSIISHCAQPAIMQPIDDGSKIEPFASLQIAKGEVQRLMDDLWRIGIRPSQIGTAGHLAAVEAHLVSVQQFAQSVALANHEKDALIAEALRSMLPARS